MSKNTIMWSIVVLSDSNNFYHCSKLFLSREKAKEESLRKEHWKRIKDIHLSDWDDFESSSKGLAYYTPEKSKKTKLATIHILKLELR